MADYKKPLPFIHNEIRPFYEKAAKHELWIQKCSACGQFYFFPRSFCPHCFSYDVVWVQVSGRGEIYSFTVTHKSVFPAFKDDVPYTIALVELAEGVRMMSHIVECSEKNLRIDMPVEVVFEDVTAEISLPKFRPTDPAIRKQVSESIPSGMV